MSTMTSKRRFLERRSPNRTPLIAPGEKAATGFSAFFHVSRARRQKTLTEKRENPEIS
ncbi:MAG: hypothetical protein LBS70_07330 [Candidatus Accumulibacter sp.]|nr:hypothetical protein [Accumulibacter sp.]